MTLGGIGMVFPASMSIGQTLGRRTPSGASALLGGLQFLFGALASPVVGLPWRGEGRGGEGEAAAA